MMWRKFSRTVLLLTMAVCSSGCSKISTPDVSPVMAEVSAAEHTSVLQSVTTEKTAAVTTETTTATTAVTTITTEDTALDAPFIDYDAGIDPDKPMVALTFDDGPGRYTNTILDTLEAYNAHATFFVIGKNINPDTAAVMRRAVDLHCEIGSHTFDHSDLVKLDDGAMLDNVQTADQAVFDAIGRYSYWLRPPYGSFDDNLRRKIGKPLAYWSVDTKDWKTKNTASTIQAATANIEDGDIVLMHDIYEPTAAAAQQIVPTLLSMGYQLVTVSELMYYRDVEMEDGMIVFSMHPDKLNYKNPPESETQTTAVTESSGAAAETVPAV